MSGEFESELGWTSITDLHADQGEDKPPEREFHNVGGRQETAFEEEEEQEESKPDAKPETREQQPQRQQYIPAQDPRMLAREIVAQMTRQSRGDPHEQAVAALLNRGVPKEALQTIEEYLTIRDHRNAQSRQSGYMEQHTAQVWGQYTDAIETAIAAYGDERLVDLQPAIEQEVFQTLQRDPEFERTWEKIFSGRNPTRLEVQKAVNKVMDRKAKLHGLAVPQASVSLQSGRPATGRPTSPADEVKSLDREGQAYYNAFKKDLGHKEALKSARAWQNSRR